MTRFSYKAATASGEVIEGEIEASNRQAAIDRLRGQGHVPIRAEEKGRGLGAGLRLGFSIGARRVGPKDLALLTRELATLLQAGLPLDRSLSVLRDLARAGPGRTLVERMQDQVRGGAALADAMEAHPEVFPNFYIGMVRAGEAGGNLESVLSALSDSLERAQALRESVSSALTYPILVVVMAILSLVVLMTAVIPEFRPLFEDSGTALPLMTRIVIAVSDFVGAYWWALALGVLALVALVRRHNSDPKGRLRWDRWVLGMPYLGDLVLKVEVTRMARTLGTLSKNGVNLLNALSMTIGTVENRVVTEALDDVRLRLAKGEGLSRPMAETSIFPTLALQLIQVGEESGALEDMLLRVADIYDEEVQRSLQRLLSLLAPLITIVLGIVIAVIIGSMIAAILSAYDLPI
jgi:general secretion pathway protein F